MGSILPPWIRGATRRLAQSFIEAGVRRGYSGAQIIRQLREAGLSYRRQEMYRDIRWWRDVVDRGSGMKYLRRDITIPEHWYLETPADWGARYATRYELRWRHPETGEETTSDIWVHHDIPLSRAEIEEDLLPDVLAGSPPKPEEQGFELVSAVPKYGVKSLAYG